MMRALNRTGLVALVIAAAACADPTGPRVPTPQLNVVQASAPPVMVYHATTPGRHRVIVWAHAGGWHSGLATLSPSSPARTFNAEGFTVVSVDYALSTAATWPRQGEDMRAAVAWIRAHQDSLGVDATRIAVWGFSAGAHLAAWTGARCVVADECVQAVVTWSAPTDLRMIDNDLIKQGCTRRASDPLSPEARLLGAVPALSPWTSDASPVARVDATAAPHIIFHGLSDCTVPVAQAGRLAVALKNAGVPVQRYQYKTGHLQTVFASDSAMARVRAFLNLHLP